MAPGIRNKWLLLSSCSNILSTSPHATLWLPSSYSYLILIHPAQKRGEKAQKVSSLPWGIYSGCYMWLLLTSSCWLELQSHGHSSCKGGWGIFFLTEHIAISNKVDREEEEKRHWHTYPYGCLCQLPKRMRIMKAHYQVQSLIQWIRLWLQNTLFEMVWMSWSLGWKHLDSSSPQVRMWWRGFS